MYPVRQPKPTSRLIGRTIKRSWNYFKGRSNHILGFVSNLKVVEVSLGGAGNAYCMIKIKTSDLSLMTDEDWMEVAENTQRMLGDNDNSN